MTKSIIVIIVIILGIAAFSLFKITHNSAPNTTTSGSPFPSGSPNPLDNLIRLEKPGPSELVRSPLNVEGEARGNWYFEASFPVKIYDENGLLLIAKPAQAQGDWMTEDFVHFQVLLEFQKPATPTGYLVLEKDNPSGLPEHDAQLKMPITFDLEHWQSNATSSGKCKITGCSGQICSDQEVVTTCEFKPEFACYKTAKCERQPDGQCGWTPTAELVQCLGEVFRSQEEGGM